MSGDRAYDPPGVSLLPPIGEMALDADLINEVMQVARKYNYSVCIHGARGSGATVVKGTIKLAKGEVVRPVHDPRSKT